jgi:hypothetical protein
LARVSAASWVDASAYTRTTSSVPDGRTKHRPWVYFAANQKNMRPSCNISTTEILKLV